MNNLIAILIALSVFFTIHKDVSHVKPDGVESIKEMDAGLLVEAVRMCLQSGLTINASFAVLQHCGINAKLVRRVNQNLAVGLPALNDVGNGLTDPGTELFVSLLERSTQTGASIENSLLVLSSQLRAQVHAKKLKLIRSVSIKAVLPLGLCFLPAFVLVGVVPIAMSFGQGIFQ